MLQKSYLPIKKGPDGSLALPLAYLNILRPCPQLSLILKLTLMRIRSLIQLLDEPRLLFRDIVRISEAACNPATILYITIDSLQQQAHVPMTLDPYTHRDTKAASGQVTLSINPTVANITRHGHSLKTYVHQKFASKELKAPLYVHEEL